MTMSPYAYAKRFRFTGFVELTYRDYSTSSHYNGRGAESNYASFEQRYNLGLKGYIYHPKLVSFSSSVTYRKENGDSGSGGNYDADGISYDFSVSILPTNPVALDVFALKSEYTIEGWGAAPFNVTSNYYGARLRLAKRKFPLIIIEYNHLDYTTERESGWLVFDYDERKTTVKTKRIKNESEIDRYYLNINGLIDTLKTRYSIMATLSDYSNPSKNYEGKNIIATTFTPIKKNILSTSFQYSDIDTYKRTTFATDLTLSPIGRLYQTYRYEYATYETESEKRDSHTIGNNFLYRFSRLSFATARLRYSFAKRDGVKEESYDINTGLNYGKPIKNIDFSSYYRFSLSKEERYGEDNYMNHSLGISLSTRKIRWGKVYANYDISISKYDYTYAVRGDDFFDSEFDELEKVSANGDSTEHRIRIGINGKGPKRAYWNIEAEGRIFDSEIEDHGTVFWIGEEQWAENIRHYTFTGDIGYPVGRRGLVTLKASYTGGETNSENVERYYYEVHLNYRFLKNLNLLAWWREDWRNKGWWAGKPTGTERAYGWKTREYQAELNYVIRRIALSIEYNVYRVEEGPYTSEYKRLFLRLRRPF